MDKVRIYVVWHESGFNGCLSVAGNYRTLEGARERVRSLINELEGEYNIKFKKVCEDDDIWRGADEEITINTDYLED